MLKQEVVDRVYECIRKHQDEEGLPPTYQIIVERTGISLSTVLRCIDRLEFQGKIYVVPNGKPAIRLINGDLREH